MCGCSGGCGAATKCGTCRRRSHRSSTCRLVPDMEAPQHLIILYDEKCALCRRCRHWLEGQETFVPLEFLAAQSPVARERYGDVPWLGADLVVVDDDGNVWAG